MTNVPKNTKKYYQQRDLNYYTQTKKALFIQIRTAIFIGVLLAVETFSGYYTGAKLFISSSPRRRFNIFLIFLVIITNIYREKLYRVTDMYE
jgi:hypothetical protein